MAPIGSSCKSWMLRKSQTCQLLVRQLMPQVLHLSRAAPLLLQLQGSSWCWWPPGSHHAQQQRVAGAGSSELQASSNSSSAGSSHASNTGRWLRLQCRGVPMPPLVATCGSFVFGGFHSNRWYNRSSSINSQGSRGKDSQGSRGNGVDRWRPQVPAGTAAPKVGAILQGSNSVLHVLALTTLSLRLRATLKQLDEGRTIHCSACYAC
jgi:hypothetical protein